MLTENFYGVEIYRALRRQGFFFFWQTGQFTGRIFSRKNWVCAVIRQNFSCRICTPGWCILIPVWSSPPLQRLGVMSEFSGLPFDILPVSLKVLQKKIRRALCEFDGEIV